MARGLRRAKGPIPQPFFPCRKVKQRKTDKNLKGAMSKFVHLEKLSLIFVACNPCYSFPSLTNLVPFLFINTSLVFVYPNKLLFSSSYYI